MIRGWGCVFFVIIAPNPLRRHTSEAGRSTPCDRRPLTDFFANRLWEGLGLRLRKFRLLLQDTTPASDREARGRENVPRRQSAHALIFTNASFIA